MARIERLADGRYCARVTIDGQRMRVHGLTEAEVQAKVDALRARVVEIQEHPQRMTLHQAMESYIREREAVLSPATVRGYKTILRSRFQPYIHKPLCNISWQRMVNDEAKVCSPKTLKNAWGFVVSVLTEAGVNPPKVRLPQVPPKERPWLDAEQVRVFLAAVEGEEWEIACLLALHGLRRSEIFALTFDSIDLARGIIHVRGAVVPNDDNEYVLKQANKNVSSTRDVPIFIPRLKKLLFLEEVSGGSGYIVQCKPDSLLRRVNRTCEAAGLPAVGVHGLRHSFASLAYELGLSEMETMALGGWSDAGTMRKIYTHLSNRKRGEGIARLSRFYSAGESRENGSAAGEKRG